MQIVPVHQTSRSCLNKFEIRFFAYLSYGYSCYIRLKNQIDFLNFSMWRDSEY